MRLDIFAPGDSVLLLGEGNFTFSVGLLKHGIEIKVTSTCFESVLSKTQIENSEFLMSNGVCIMTGVDATQVHEHAVLKSKKFDKIVFNFPHTGGKMKINQNRELLRNFFLSASKILSLPRGNIIVSLCGGQGADYSGKRLWADSWQVVDMAGSANLLLVECSPFNWSTFPSYINVGYRSQEKGFHSEDAMVHIFSYIESSLSSLVEKVTNFYEKKIEDDISASPLFERKLKQNILGNQSSPFSFILKHIAKKASLSCNSIHYPESKTFTHSMAKDDISSAVLQWRDSGFDMSIYSVYTLNHSTADFKQVPISIQTLLIGSQVCDIFLAAIAELMLLFGLIDYQVTIRDHDFDPKKEILVQNNNQSDVLLLAELLSLGCGEDMVLVINVDNLVSKMFSVKSWRQLWAGNAHVTFHNGNPAVGGICPYPVCYTFDMSFAVPESFSEELFFKVLWDICAEIVINVTKVSEFCPSVDYERSLCFRISYLSYEYPMCRQSVIKFHQNGLGLALESILGVRLK